MEKFLNASVVLDSLRFARTIKIFCFTKILCYNLCKKKWGDVKTESRKPKTKIAKDKNRLRRTVGIVLSFILALQMISGLLLDLKDFIEPVEAMFGKWDGYNDNKTDSGRRLGVRAWESYAGSFSHDPTLGGRAWGPGAGMASINSNNILRQYKDTTFNSKKHKQPTFFMDASAGEALFVAYPYSIYNGNGILPFGAQPHDTYGAASPTITVTSPFDQNTRESDLRNVWTIRPTTTTPGIYDKTTGNIAFYSNGQAQASASIPDNLKVYIYNNTDFSDPNYYPRVPREIRELDSNLNQTSCFHGTGDAVSQGRVIVFRIPIPAGTDGAWRVYVHSKFTGLNPSEINGGSGNAYNRATAAAYYIYDWQAGVSSGGSMVRGRVWNNFWNVTTKVPVDEARPGASGCSVSNVINGIVDSVRSVAITSTNTAQNSDRSPFYAYVPTGVSSYSIQSPAPVSSNKSTLNRIDFLRLDGIYFGIWANSKGVEKIEDITGTNFNGTCYDIDGSTAYMDPDLWQSKYAGDRSIPMDLYPDDWYRLTGKQDPWKDYTGKFGPYSNEENYRLYLSPPTFPELADDVNPDSPAGVTDINVTPVTGGAGLPSYKISFRVTNPDDSTYSDSPLSAKIILDTNTNEAGNTSLGPDGIFDFADTYVPPTGDFLTTPGGESSYAWDGKIFNPTTGTSQHICEIYDLITNDPDVAVPGTLGVYIQVGSGRVHVPMGDVENYLKVSTGYPNDPDRDWAFKDNRSGDPPFVDTAVYNTGAKIQYIKNQKLFRDAMAVNPAPNLAGHLETPGTQWNDTFAVGIDDNTGNTKAPKCPNGLPDFTDGCAFSNYFITNLKSFGSSGFLASLRHKWYSTRIDSVGNWGFIGAGYYGEDDLDHALDRTWGDMDVIDSWSDGISTDGKAYVPISCINPWLQTRYGDVHSNSLNSLTLSAPSGQDNATFYITAGGGISARAGGGTFPNYNTGSILDWGNIVSSMRSERDRLRGSATSLSGTVSASSLSGSTYYSSGDLTISSGTVPNGAHTVIVDGNLTINGNINSAAGPYATASAIPTLGFIVLKNDAGNGGNIIINGGVTQANAAFYAENNIDFGSSGNPFNSSGFMVAKNYNLTGRVYNAGDNPAIVVKFTAAYVLNTPPGFTKANKAIQSWKETAP